MKKIQNLRNSNGFTLVEMIVVICIIGILAGFILPKTSKFIDEAHKKSVMTEAKQIKEAMDGIRTETGTWPKLSKDGVEDVVKYAGKNFDGTLKFVAGDGSFEYEKKVKEKYYKATFTPMTSKIEILGPSDKATVSPY